MRPHDQFRAFVCADAPLGCGPNLTCATVIDDGNDRLDSPSKAELWDIAVRGPQRAMGELIEEVCPGGVSRVAILVQDLADRCTDVVLEVLVDGDLAGAEHALEQMAGEEVSVAGTSQLDASSAHLDPLGACLASQRADGPRVAISAAGFEPAAVAAACSAGWLFEGGARDAAIRVGFFVSGNCAYDERDASINEFGFKSALMV